jgi:glutamyl-tRNA reductase
VTAPLPRDDAPFAVVELDWRRGGTRTRAAMALDAEGRQALFRDLTPHGQEGLVQIATCNRTTWVAAGEQPAWLGQLLGAQVAERLADAFPADPAPTPRVLTGAAAAEHLLRTSLGLESLAKGDAQIAGQMHDAFEVARREGTSCGHLNVLETIIGRTVRRASALPRAKGRVGLSTLVVEALRQQGVARGAPVLVVGLGAIGRATLDDLRTAGFTPIGVNRTAKPGALLLSDARRHAPPHAAVVLCSGAATPVWGRDQLVPDVVVVDIGSPPQLDADAKAALGDRAVDLDDLARRHAANVAAHDGARVDVVRGGLDELGRALGFRRLRDVVRATHERYQQLAWTELPNLLDAAALPPAERQRLEVELRRWLRGYAHAVLDAVEGLSDEVTT